jgi:hypothetical protein
MGSSASWELGWRNRRWLDIASPSETALPDLGSFSDRSSGRDCGHRPFQPANGDLPDFLVFVVLSQSCSRTIGVV